MALERVVLDGFRYEIEPAALWRSDKGREDRIVILHAIDEARGIHVEMYFPAEAWPTFSNDVAAGAPVLTPDLLRRIGV